MEIEGWKYYNHAAIPTTAPHEEPDLLPIKNGKVWKMGGVPLLARWTTDFDCGNETNWWYVIKDEPFDINTLKSKRRYEIKKGVKNFEVRHINPTDYKKEIYKVQVAAFSAYPKKYRPTDLTVERLDRSIDEWVQNKSDVFGTFRSIENKAQNTTEPVKYFETELVGYAVLTKKNKVIYFDIEKTNPSSERDGVNAATVYGILKYYKDDLMNGCYICDGERPINHETHFQDYLEKYFEFRKAYCRLNVTYKKTINLFVSMLYPFRRLLPILDRNSMIHKISGVLKMEEIVKNQGCSENSW